jgi:hypothetical protein
MYLHQRLRLAVRCKSLEKRYVPEMFGENFMWWYLKSYRHQLVPLEWEAGHHIAELMKWLSRNADRSQLAEWSERAEKMGDPTPGEARPGRVDPTSTA